MKVNLFERLLVNNPIRTAMLRETLRWLRSHSNLCRPARVLEIGCGWGAGIGEILLEFAAEQIHAFDLDIRQVARAVSGRAQGASVWVGDAAAIATPSAAYDAVFEFTIFHHLPNWPTALAEVRRVLKPGGLFLFEELSREFFYDTPLLGFLLRRGTVHPWDSMFDFGQFREGLLTAGLRPSTIRGGLIPGWHVGVAEAV